MAAYTMAFGEHRRFQLRAELGRGGMGVVYEAFDTERRQQVALKKLHRCDPEVIVSLKQEFRSLSEIAHPRLISMYELLGEGDQWFFTMELLRDVTSLMQQAAPLAPKPDLNDGSEATLEADSEALAAIAALMEAAMCEQLASGALDETLADTPETTSYTVQVAEDEARTVAGRTNAAHAAGVQTVEAPTSDGPPRVRPAADITLPGAPPPPVFVRSDLHEADVERLTTLFGQLAEGVHALHGFGKLHRDLKPGNVVVRADGNVVILDFGLAITGKRRNRGAATGHAILEGADSDGTISGTIPYMSPEQAAGQPLTEASDWYAVGTMLFEALAGRLPFSGDARSVLRAKTTTPAPDLQVPAEAPATLAALAGLTNALLRAEPSARPRGAEILASLGASTETILPLEQEAPFVGRTQLLGELRHCFALCQKHAVIAQVHGRSGSGKTALTEHFLDNLPPRPAPLVLRGRCYEQESVPYKTMDGVADSLAGWLVGLPAAEQRALLPPDAAALARIFPVFLRVGAVAAAAQTGALLDLAELRRRAFEAFADLLERVAERQPTVLCIDDLQWGDADGVAMLETALLRPRLRVLVLLTYRDEYFNSSPALRALAEMHERLGSLHVHDLPVEPLTQEESAALLRELLPPGKAAPPPETLQAMLQQAAGSPYFLSELVRFGADAGFAAGAGLDEVLWRRIGALPTAERTLLETVAVSGQPIRLREAQGASGLHAMPPSVLTGLRMHRLVRSNGLGAASEVQTYHDRIRETVLAHLTAERRASCHLELGLCLETAGYETPDTLAVHFEQGGRPEHASTYYEAAAGSAVQALAFARAEELFKKASALTTDPTAKVRVAERLVHLLSDLARFPEAYATGREALATLGLQLPPKFVPPAFALDLARNWKLLLRRTAERIPALPTSADPDHIQRVRLLAAVGKAAYQIRPELCIAILLKLVNSCVKRGNTPEAAIGYMAVGSIFFGGIAGRYDSGYQYGQVALDLVQRYDAARIRAEVQFVVGYFGVSWRRPAAEAEALWASAREAGLASGDLFHVGCASCATVMSQWMRGVPLEELRKNSEPLVQVISRYNLQEPGFVMEAVRRSVQALRDGEATLPEAPTPPRPLDRFGSRHFAHFSVLLEMQLHLLYGRYPEAVEAGLRGNAFLPDSKGMLHRAEHVLYLALARLACASSESPLRRRRTLVATYRSLRRLERWAAGAPENFQAKALLLRAEWSAARGRHDRALHEFRSAAHAALCYAQPHIAALAYQRSAFYAARSGELSIAEQLLEEAARLYEDWGAFAFAARLRQQPVVESLAA